MGLDYQTRYTFINCIRGGYGRDRDTGGRQEGDGRMVGGGWEGDASAAGEKTNLKSVHVQYSEGA